MNMLSASTIPFLYNLHNALNLGKMSYVNFFFMNRTFCSLFFIFAKKVLLLLLGASIIS
jgi:hypothetical protein